jgi:hypothetical protein
MARSEDAPAARISATAKMETPLAGCTGERRSECQRGLSDHNAAPIVSGKRLEAGKSLHNRVRSDTYEQDRVLVTIEVELRAEYRCFQRHRGRINSV